MMQLSRNEQHLIRQPKTCAVSKVAGAKKGEKKVIFRRRSGTIFPLRKNAYWKQHNSMIIDEKKALRGKSIPIQPRYLGYSRHAI